MTTAEEPVEVETPVVGADGGDGGEPTGPDDGEPGTVAADELGIPGDAEPMPEEEPTDDGPDELGDDHDDTTDDAPVVIDPDAPVETTEA